MMIDEVPIRPSDQPDVRLERQLASARLENSPDRGECRQKRRGVRQVLEEITAEHDIDRVGGDVRRQLMTGREHFFGAWREPRPDSGSISTAMRRPQRMCRRNSPNPAAVRDGLLPRWMLDRTWTLRRRAARISVVPGEVCGNSASLHGLWIQRQTGPRQYPFLRSRQRVLTLFQRAAAG